jgi:heat shock protein HslJ/uncharacterized membrane protein
MKLKISLFIFVGFLMLAFTPTQSFLMLNDKMNKDKPSKPSSLKDNAIDFKATGNEPSWSLEIDFDQKMHFKSLNHPQELITPVPKPELVQDQSAERYHAITERGELLVTISQKICTDPMSGEKFPSSVSVFVKLTTDDDFTEYTGCGGRLLDYRLHNIWALEEMEGEKMTADDFGKEIPVLEIFTAEGRVGGQDGCNRLSGKVYGNKTHLEFGILISTRMACPKMDKSAQFQELLSEQNYSYHFEPRRLVLSQNGKAVLKFKNVD